MTLLQRSPPLTAQTVAQGIIPIFQLHVSSWIEILAAGANFPRRKREHTTHELGDTQYRTGTGGV